jgi:hypothetical protein
MVRLQVHPRLVKTARGLSSAEREAVNEALNLLRESFGNPHVHSGLGIRRLRRDLFECRAGLELRILFYAESGLLTAFDVVNHREVRNYLKSL